MLAVKNLLTLKDLDIKLQPNGKVRRTNNPIPHNRLVEALRASAISRGWSLSNQRFHLGNNYFEGSLLVASWDVRIPLPPPGCVFSLGLINDNAENLTLRLIGGVRVLKPDVGVPLSEFELGRHTANWELSDRLDEAMTAFARATTGYERLINRLSEQHVSDDEAGKLLLIASRNGLIPWSRTGLVDRAFRNAERKTAWVLLTTFAEVARQNPPHKQLRQVLKFVQTLQERA
jgi:hypothetical protein